MLQDATFSINNKAILRPKANIKSGKEIKLHGEYFLNKFTRHFKDKEGKSVTEDIAWMDEVRSPATKDKVWLVHQITGAPFDETKRRHQP